MAVGFCEMRIDPGDVRGQPLTVLERHEPIFSAVPQLHGDLNVGKVETPRHHLRDVVLPPALVTGSKSRLESGQEFGRDLKGQRFRIGRRQQGRKPLVHPLRCRSERVLAIGTALLPSSFRVVEQELHVVSVVLTHAGKEIQAVDPIRSGGTQRRYSGYKVRQQRRARQCVRTATGDSPNPEPLDPEGCGDRGDVVCAVGHAASRLSCGTAVPGTVVTKEMDSAMLRIAHP